MSFPKLNPFVLPELKKTCKPTQEIPVSEVVASKNARFETYYAFSIKDILSSFSLYIKQKHVFRTKYVNLVDYIWIFDPLKCILGSLLRLFYNKNVIGFSL